ncbi:hypothetical protein [Methyloglobulus sp.]|uniref:hypothetical protein n=1 Tax=Methyloglobulus sp. TaxID=2518622 RepID=UPI003989B62E
MKCFRSVLVGFVVVACFFLSGFKKHESSTKNQQSAGEAKHQQKPLDLTVPLRDVSFQATPETLAIVQGALPEALVADNKGKIRAVELQGNVIMSQEPEAGKTKSADGAGIVINLRH